MYAGLMFGGSRVENPCIRTQNGAKDCLRMYSPFWRSSLSVKSTVLQLLTKSVMSGKSLNAVTYLMNVLCVRIDKLFENLSVE
jgi:hypothetical protein